MTKDVYNPALLLIVVVLFSWSAVGSNEAVNDTMTLWVLVMSFTGVVVNGALCLARALSRRPPVSCLAWAVGFLVLGSSAWVMLVQEQRADLREDEAAFMNLKDAWERSGKADAVTEDGDTLIVLAASMGRTDVLNALLGDAQLLQEHADELQKAAARAAGEERLDALKLLLDRGISVNSLMDGTTLLNMAVAHDKKKAVVELLTRGANVNQPDVEGTTPLMHAVMNSNPHMVELLLQYGADPSLLNEEGRDAASYSRNEQIDDLLGL